MSVFTIADLHLSLGTDKPMDIFGGKWKNHTSKLKEEWQSTVVPDDYVIIPGDISWGMKFENTSDDLLFVESLNGSKIIGKGNHDYWWQTLKKLNEYKEKIGAKTLNFLYNNAYVCENLIICGTRGWFVDTEYSPEDEKIVNREAERLKLSLNEGYKLKKDYPDNEITVFLHYPPAYNNIICEKIANILIENDIKRCFYGHLHNVSESRLETHIGNTRLFCIAADHINFKPMKIN